MQMQIPSLTISEDRCEAKKAVFQVEAPNKHEAH